MEEGSRAHYAGARHPQTQRDRSLVSDVINAKASSRRSSFMVIVNVRTAGELPMVIAARARRSERLGSSQFNSLFSISKKVRHYRS